MNALIINCSPVRNGATAEIVRLVSQYLGSRYETKAVCIDDYHFAFCRGCRSCHKTAECVQKDDADRLMEEIARADVIVSVSPSYWADIPGPSSTGALPGATRMSRTKPFPPARRDMRLRCAPDPA